MKTNGSKPCPTCGRTISANKTYCLACFLAAQAAATTKARKPRAKTTTTTARKPRAKKAAEVSVD